MSTSQHAFAAAQYGVRAHDYVTSAVHSQGADLDQIEAILREEGAIRALDLGCGGGHVSYCASPYVAEVVACDVTASMLEAVAATAAERGLDNISVQQAPAENLPFPDAFFDVVLCRFTAHHWQDLEAGLRQARRVIKPGGRAILIDSIAAADRVLDSYLQAVELLRDASHVRNYSASELISALARSGFAVEGITHRKLRMEFPVWVARTRTPELHADAIRSLLAAAPGVVQDHFGVGPDGSFDLETVTLVLRAA